MEALKVTKKITDNCIFIPAHDYNSIFTPVFLNFAPLPLFF